MKKRKKNKKFKNSKLFKFSIKFKIKFYTFIILLICILLLALFIYQFETQVVPTALAISEKYATNMINQEIDMSVKETIEDMNLFSSDFFNKSLNQNTNNFLDINTILINSVCLNVSKNLNKRLENINEMVMKLPIGIFSGFNAFSGMGPKFKVNVFSMREATIDYETKFESVGINQINFQIYLNIKTEIAIVNPMYKKNVEISRKLMLVNTVFNGEVPNTYLNLPNNNTK